MYLLPSNQKLLAELLASTLWQDVERCMRERYPEQPDPKDPSHIAAAKGHQRAGYDRYADELKKLPTDVETTAQNPFDSPAFDTKD